MLCGMGLGILAAGEGGDHLVHEARDIAHRHARDGILAADHAHAEGLHGLDQALAHEAARRAEGPCLQVCVTARCIERPGVAVRRNLHTPQGLLRGCKQRSFCSAGQTWRR